jgi:hypothetical protein
MASNFVVLLRGWKRGINPLETEAGGSPGQSQIFYFTIYENNGISVGML